MRPSELCRMRPCDVEQRPDGTWIYRPSSHKTDYRGKDRAIPIVGDLRIVLGPYLDRAPGAYCFSPRESMTWFREQRTANRKTPNGPGRNAVGKNRKANPKKQPSEKYTSGSYCQAIKRAAKRAKVEHWFPYQLRHSAATAVREALGVEAAGALLGHARIDMTQHYARLAESRAIEAAKVARTCSNSRVQKNYCTHCCLCAPTRYDEGVMSPKGCRLAALLNRMQVDGVGRMSPASVFHRSQSC